MKGTHGQPDHAQGTSTPSVCIHARRTKKMELTTKAVPILAKFKN